jgi:hypothetical protein
MLILSLIHMGRKALRPYIKGTFSRHEATSEV